MPLPLLATRRRAQEEKDGDGDDDEEEDANDDEIEDECGEKSVLRLFFLEDDKARGLPREGERRETGKQRRLFRPQESGKGKRKRIGLQNENKPKNKCFYDVLRLRR